MKVSDYIIEFLVSKNVTDIFGYPGGVICHIIDSVTKYKNKITAHALYHEQACAFAVCSYAQATHNLGAAFATSGPGATNLITGIANAYYDSIPVMFLTGNVDTYISKGEMKIRQKGFQETDFVSLVQSITKYCVSVKSPEDIRYCLEKAYFFATNGRPGPVVLDLPADIQRTNVDIEALKFFLPEKVEFQNYESAINELTRLLNSAQRPCFLVGAAIKQTGNTELLRRISETLHIPVVTSMPTADILPWDHELMGGFIGTNGHRCANFIISKSDLVIVIGSRLDLKQVGNKRENFASNARIFRIDVDSSELDYKIRTDDIVVHADISLFLNDFGKHLADIKSDTKSWINVCKQIKTKLKDIDQDAYHYFIEKFSRNVPEGVNITVDTGQSSVWAVQSFLFKNNQTLFISSGLGSMGYSLPAAIGAYYANKLPIVCFNGGAGIQMNIQELAYIGKEQIPIIIVIVNNASLGMIRHFQEKNFNKNYYLTTADSGYMVPDFEKLAYAYNLKYKKISPNDKFENKDIYFSEPYIIDVQFDSATYLFPNFAANRPLEDMDPYIDRDLYKELVEL